MFEHLSYLWKEVRITSKYTSEQKTCLSSLRSLYQKHFSVDEDAMKLHDELFSVNPKGIPSISEEHLTSLAKEMSRVFLDNPLTVYLNSILLFIAEYCHLRKDGFRGTVFYQNDPRALFCMLLAKWAKQTMLGDRNQHLVDTISRWVDFLKEIEMQQIFKMDETAKTHKYATLNAVLENSQRQLEVARLYIQTEIQERGVGKELETIVNKGRTFLDTCFAYLAGCMSADTNLPLNFCCVASFHCRIRNDLLQSYMLKNVHGSLLAELAQTDCFKDLFGLHCVDTLNIQLDMHPHQQLQQQVDQQQPEFKQVIQAVLHEEAPPTQEIVSIFGNCGGVAGIFTDNKELIQRFLHTHGRLLILAELLVSCREAARVASVVGELLLCNTERSMNLLKFLVTSVEHIVTHLQSDLQFIFDSLAQQSRAVLFTKGSASAEQKKLFAKWVANYKDAFDLESKMSETVHEIVSGVGALQGQLSQPSLKVQQAADRLHSWLLSLQKFKHRMGWLNVPTYLKQEISDLPSLVMLPTTTTAGTLTSGVDESSILRSLQFATREDLTAQILLLTQQQQQPRQQLTIQQGSIGFPPPQQSGTNNEKPQGVGNSCPPLAPQHTKKGLCTPPPRSSHPLPPHPQYPTPQPQEQQCTYQAEGAREDDCSDDELYAKVYGCTRGSKSGSGYSSSGASSGTTSFSSDKNSPDRYCNTDQTVPRGESRPQMERSRSDSRTSRGSVRGASLSKRCSSLRSKLITQQTHNTGKGDYIGVCIGPFLLSHIACGGGIMYSMKVQQKKEKSHSRMDCKEPRTTTSSSITFPQHNQYVPSRFYHKTSPMLPDLNTETWNWDDRCIMLLSRARRHSNSKGYVCGQLKGSRLIVQVVEHAAQQQLGITHNWDLVKLYTSCEQQGGAIIISHVFPTGVQLQFRMSTTHETTPKLVPP